MQQGSFNVRGFLCLIFLREPCSTLSYDVIGLRHVRSATIATAGLLVSTKLPYCSVCHAVKEKDVKLVGLVELKKLQDC